MGSLGRALRGGAGRVRGAARRRARRRRDPDLGLGRRQRRCQRRSASEASRNRIVISENEFPTIGQIAHAQELRGAEIVHVEPEPEAYAAAIDERTALVASTLVSYRTGAVHDVEAIYGIAREHGALMLVDGYQGIGALPLEAAKRRRRRRRRHGQVPARLGRARVHGAAGRASSRSSCPSQTGWFADENVFDMQIERYRPHRSARRFDAGTPPVPNIYAGVAGVGLIAEAGVPAIQQHVRGLVERLLAGLDELGAPGRGTAARPARLRALDRRAALVDALAAEDIVASERDSNLRVSLHLYNTDDDVDAVLAALARTPVARWLDRHSKIAIIANMRYASEAAASARTSPRTPSRRRGGLVLRRDRDRGRRAPRCRGVSPSASSPTSSGRRNRRSPGSRAAVRPPRIDTLLRIADALDCDLHVELTPRADSTEGTT